MKKLSFLFAMIFAVSMAMAQTAVIDQDNKRPDGTLDVNVAQTGGDEYTKIMQLNDKANNAPTAITATVKQTGTHNNKGNDAIIDQSLTGTGNVGETFIAEIEQTGKLNLAKQTQISTSSNLNGKQDFYAKQNGSENKMIQYSISGNHTFWALQVGDNNEGLQKTLPAVGSGNTADLLQKGDDNYASQKFAGTAVNIANIEQVGNDNEAYQTFSGGTFGNGGADRPKADIFQKGDDDYAYQSQDGIGSYQYAFQKGNGGNESRQLSDGNYNNSYVKQTGKDGFVKVEQYSDAVQDDLSDGNSAMLSQAGNDSEARIWQDGLRNEVVGLGGSGTYAINNAGAFLKVKQDGNDNIVMSRQLVAGSETVTQTGINNSATVNQY